MNGPALDFRLTGPMSTLVERFAGRMVGGKMTATLLAAGRLCEFEAVGGKAR